MARYIDADKLKDAFHTDTEHLQSRDEHLFDLIMFEIDELPTADVVEVVRCKECKHSYINSFSAQSGVALCKFWSNRAEGNSLVVQQDDYCSYGERKCDNG